jgi:hypothetical protein
MGVYDVESLEHYNHCEELSLSLSTNHPHMINLIKKTRLKWTKMISWIYARIVRKGPSELERPNK